MFESAQKQMARSIEENGIVGGKVARELIGSATKKLDAAAKHRDEQPNYYC